MSPSDDDGYAISYKVLERGTPVVASDGTEIGRVRDVLENVAEHIFDGLVIDTPGGERFVDAPEIARIAERRVTLTLDAEGAAGLPERDPKGAPTYRANARGGRLSRLFGGGWKRD
jgi:sporulation protein YlmC with PRC-barrel domain